MKIQAYIAFSALFPTQVMQLAVKMLVQCFPPVLRAHSLAQYFVVHDNAKHCVCWGLEQNYCCWFIITLFSMSSSVFYKLSRAWTSLAELPSIFVNMQFFFFFFVTKKMNIYT